MKFKPATKYYYEELEISLTPLCILDPDWAATKITTLDCTARGLATQIGCMEEANLVIRKKIWKKFIKHPEHHPSQSCRECKVLQKIMSPHWRDYLNKE